MMQIPRLLSNRLRAALALFLLLAASFSSYSYAHVTSPTVANPGEELLSVSNTLAPGQSSLQYQVFETGVVNFELVVSGGASSADALSLRVTQTDGDPKTWTARHGERLWGTIQLKSTSNQWQVTNTSSTTLSYQLKVYAQGQVPVVASGGKSWSGVSTGEGLSSTIQLDFPRAGLYDFAFTLGGGRYQFVLDNNYFQQTVEGPETVRAYVSAGVHTLRVVQDSAQASTSWGVTITDTNVSQNSLPYSQGDGELRAQLFNTTWLPLSVEEASDVNIQVAVQGSGTDSISFELYQGATGATPAQTGVTVYGGETVWLPASVAAGVNRLHVTAAPTNTAPLSVTLAVRAVPGTPSTWAGKSRGANSRTSQSLLDIAEAGIYSFNFKATSGRYQFLLNDDYLQTTVASDGSVQAYVPAGRHTLTVVQDSAQSLTNWSVGITQVTSDTDTLPYSQMGGQIGGSGNDYREEWRPLQLAAGAEIITRVTVTGTLTDSLAVELYDAEGLVARRPAVYGGETIWLTTDLSEGLNRLRVAGAASGAPLNYQVDVFPLADVPTAWAGVALASGDDSFVRFVAPVDGVYDIEFSYSEGAIQPLIDPATPNMMRDRQTVPNSSGTIRIRAPLSAGVHTLQLAHDKNQPRTVWEGNVSLRAPSEELTVARVTPSTVIAGSGVTMTITGTGFELNAAVSFVDGGGEIITATEVTVKSGTEIEVVVPASLAVGTYDVRVSNPRAETAATLEDGLTVIEEEGPEPPPGESLLFLPMVRR